MEPTQPNPIMMVLKQIWPTIYRVVNGSFYFLMSTIKSIIKMSIEQIKGNF